MDIVSLWFGLTLIVLGGVVLNEKGLGRARRGVVGYIYKAALAKPLVREFPSSRYVFVLDTEDKAS
ncbi:MAG: hypothetical protein PHU06_13330 [Gallionella sp.]|nr:hypothetical protein [Gallionella sp.]MDD4959800.1 hypothetical protein [Gallionella sp.]